MKKLISILISLLLLASAFGVGTVMADCEPRIVAPPSVQIGTIFQVRLIDPPDRTGYHISWNTGNEGIEYLGASSTDTYFYIFTYKASRLGTYENLVSYQVTCGDITSEYNYYGITVIPKQLPMHQFMKILGIGGLMRE